MTDENFALLLEQFSVAAKESRRRREQTVRETISRKKK